MRRRFLYMGNTDQGSYSSEKTEKDDEESKNGLSSVLPGGAAAEQAFGCAKQACGGAQSAASTATDALGPPPAYIPQSQLDAMAMDKSPAGIARYEEALRYNAEVERQTAERQTIIDRFVKDAMGGNITGAQIAAGDKLQKKYVEILQKHGQEAGTMTMEEFKAAHPEETAELLENLSEIFPNLAGMDANQIWNLIPGFMKSMTLSDLVGVIPKSTWLTGQDMQPVGSGGISIVPIALAGIGILAVFYMMKRK